ncbi:unnamed protein product [Closterium sp. NIES-65]|nr:unnamed protein product [Closterium sp. NIES-65]
MAKIGRRQKGEWHPAVEKQFWVAHRRSYQLIKKWRRIDMRGSWWRFFPFLVVYRGFNGQKTVGVKESYPWAYQQWLDSLLRLPAVRQRRFLAFRHATSPITNALGALVFLGTPFYIKKWQRNGLLWFALSLLFSVALMYVFIIAYTSFIQFIVLLIAGRLQDPGLWWLGGVAVAVGGGDVMYILIISYTSFMQFIILLIARVVSERCWLWWLGVVLFVNVCLAVPFSVPCRSFSSVPPLRILKSHVVPFSSVPPFENSQKPCRSFLFCATFENSQKPCRSFLFCATFENSQKPCRSFLFCATFENSQKPCRSFLFCATFENSQKSCRSFLFCATHSQLLHPVRPAFSHCNISHAAGADQADHGCGGQTQCFTSGNLYHNPAFDCSPAMSALVIHAGKLDEVDWWAFLFHCAIILVWDTLFFLPAAIMSVCSHIIAPIVTGTIQKMVVTISFGLSAGDLNQRGLLASPLTSHLERGFGAWWRGEWQGELAPRQEGRNKGVSLPPPAMEGAAAVEEIGEGGVNDADGAGMVEDAATAAAGLSSSASGGSDAAASSPGLAASSDTQQHPSSQKERMVPVPEAPEDSGREKLVYEFLWDDQELAIIAEQSQTFQRLKSQMNKIGRNPRLSEREFERQLQQLCVMIEERMGELTGKFDLNHGAYFRDPRILRVIAHFIEKRELPEWSKDMDGDIWRWNENLAKIQSQQLRQMATGSSSGGAGEEKGRKEGRERERAELRG